MFDYRWKMIKKRHFLNYTMVKETTMRWIAQHISVDREGADLVLEPEALSRRPT